MVRQWHLNLGAMALAAVGLTALFFSSVGDSYAAPSLVVNGGFTDNVNNFTDDANVTTVWDGATDVQNDPDSGSADVTYDGAADGEGRVYADCITIGATGSYPFSAFARAGAQWTDTGLIATSSWVDLQFDEYDSADCTGVALATVTYSNTLLGDPGAGWVQLAGTLNVVDPLVITIQVALVVHGETVNDAVTWDEVGLALTALDTPTPFPSSTATSTNTATNTPTPTDTPTPTNTPLPGSTNTPTPTNTPVPPTNTPAPGSTDTPVTETDTPEPTETPFPTHTPTGTSTSVPTATSTTEPEPIVEEVTDDTGAPPEADLEGGVGAGGESPEQGVGAGGEQPEGSEFPQSGTGPGSYGAGGGSAAADTIATFAFALALGMLGTGFYLRKKYQNVE